MTERRQRIGELGREVGEIEGTDGWLAIGSRQNLNGQIEARLLLAIARGEATGILKLAPDSQERHRLKGAFRRGLQLVEAARALDAKVQSYKASTQSEDEA